jgi:hypothetical protein
VSHTHNLVLREALDEPAEGASEPLRRRLHPSAYVSIRQRLGTAAPPPASISIRQHTSAPRNRYAAACIRQHPSAYASIRQHSSAYVSIRHLLGLRVWRRLLPRCSVMLTEPPEHHLAHTRL